LPIAPSTTVRQSKDQVSCNLNGEVAILHLKSTHYFGLNELGAYIWQALSEPRTVSEICKALLDHFDVDDERCRTDVSEFLTKLEQAGLIEFVPSNVPASQ
jgi:hypothetical protein